MVCCMSLSSNSPPRNLLTDFSPPRGVLQAAAQVISNSGHDDMIVRDKMPILTSYSMDVLYVGFRGTD